VPPAPNSASSGCAVTTITRSMLSVMNTLLVGYPLRSPSTVPAYPFRVVVSRVDQSAVSRMAAAAAIIAQWHVLEDDESEW
jgi:hypothetical protein